MRSRPASASRRPAARFAAPSGCRRWTAPASTPWPASCRRHSSPRSPTPLQPTRTVNRLCCRRRAARIARPRRGVRAGQGRGARRTAGTAAPGHRPPPPVPALQPHDAANDAHPTSPPRSPNEPPMCRQRRRASSTPVEPVRHTLLVAAPGAPPRAGWPVRSCIPAPFTAPISAWSSWTGRRHVRRRLHRHSPLRATCRHRANYIC